MRRLVITQIRPQTFKYSASFVFLDFSHKIKGSFFFNAIQYTEKGMKLWTNINWLYFFLNFKNNARGSIVSSS